MGGELNERQGFPNKRKRRPDSLTNIAKNVIKYSVNSEQKHGLGNPDPTSALQSSELQTLLWDQEELVKRVGLVMEARMLRALTTRYSSSQEVPESQYRRFEQFVFRIQTTVSQLREDVRDIFRSPAMQDIALLAQEIQQKIRTAQTLIRDHVAVSMSKGNGPSLNAMQVAADTLEQPITLDDLEEGKVLEALELPVPATLTAEQFFRVEKKPEPTVSTAFDGSDPPNMWETTVAAEAQTERFKETMAFRWSWTDGELFAHRKLPPHYRCRYLPEEIWLEAEKAFTEGFKQWKQQCLEMLPSSERFMGETNGKYLSRTETLKLIERRFLGEMPSYRKLLADNLAEGVLWKSTITMMETEVPKNLCTFCQIEGGPEPSFISDVLGQYFSKLQEGTPMAFPLVQPSLVSDDPNCVAYIVKVPDRLTINRDTPAKIVAKEWGISKTKSLQTAIVETIGEKYQTDQHRGNILHSTWEVSQLLQHAIERALEAIPWIPACDSQFGFIAFCKDILKCALEEIARFQSSEISSGLLAEIKNASSFEVSRRVREFSLVYPLCFSWSQDERYLEGLRDFYPTPPETESCQSSSDQVETMDPENVSSRPLTKEELLGGWEATVDRMAVRMSKMPFLALPTADGSAFEVYEIDSENIQQEGITIIGRYCSSGAVGKKRIRELHRELVNSLRFLDDKKMPPPNRELMKSRHIVCMGEIQRMFANIDAHSTNAASENNTAVASLEPMIPSSPARGASSREIQVESGMLATVPTQAIRELLCSCPVFNEMAGFMHQHVGIFEHMQDRALRWEIMDGLEKAMSLRRSMLQEGAATPDQAIALVQADRHIWSLLASRARAYLPTEMTPLLSPEKGNELLELERQVRRLFAERVEKEEVTQEPTATKLTLIALLADVRDRLGSFCTNAQRARLDSLEPSLEAEFTQAFTERENFIRREIIDPLSERLTREQCLACIRRILTEVVPIQVLTPSFPTDILEALEREFHVQWEGVRQRLPELFPGAEQQIIERNISKEALRSLLSDLRNASALERVTWVTPARQADIGYEKAKTHCGQVLQSLFDELPSLVTQQQCRIFIYAARATMLPLEEALPFSPSIRGEYKKSFDRISACAERAITALFVPQSPCALGRPARGTRIEGSDTQGRSFSREEIAGAIEDVLDEVDEAGRKRFHEKQEIFNDLLELYRQSFLGAMRRHCPKQFSTDVDLVPLEDFCRFTNDPTQRTPPPSEMERWLMEAYPPRFTAVMETFKRQLPTSPRKPSAPGMLTRKQVMEAVGRLQGKLEEQIAQLPDMPKGKTVKSEVSNVLLAARSIVVMRCPEPLRSAQDLQPLRDSMQRISSGPFVLRSTQFQKDESTIIAREIEGLITELGQRFTVDEDEPSTHVDTFVQERVMGEVGPEKVQGSSPKSPKGGECPARRAEAIAVSHSTLIRWWQSVRLEAESRLQVSVQNTTCLPGEFVRNILSQLPSLPSVGQGVLGSREACTAFIEELRQGVERLPRTIVVGGVATAMPVELRVFLSGQIAHMKQGLLARKWPIVRESRSRRKKRTVTVHNTGESSGETEQREEAHAFGGAESSVQNSVSEVAPRAERLCDLLHVYDIAPEQIVERLSHAIADHVAHAAAEALSAHSQQLSQEELDRAAGELRRCVERVNESARVFLEPVASESLTAAQLLAAVAGALDSVLDGLDVHADIAGAMRVAIAEHRSAVGSAAADDVELLALVMEGGENGLHLFKETARMLRIAREDSQMRQHGERIQQSQRQISAGLERLTTLSEEYAEQARHGATEIERQDAAQEVEQIQGYIQTILGMYQGKTPPPHSAE
ncbi:MAG: hypothetical protein Q7S29_05055 [Candidatus Peribacter sp.]|nr:hypothetical protein [Candidatus Peribacter sp.]